jgi:hypothetical protein
MLRCAQTQNFNNSGQFIEQTAQSKLGVSNEENVTISFRTLLTLSYSIRLFAAVRGQLHRSLNIKTFWSALDVARRPTIINRRNQIKNNKFK